MLWLGFTVHLNKWVHPRDALATGVSGHWQAILDTYHAVGILEHWDLSMRLFDARVKSPVARWTDLAFKVNPGTQSAKRQELLEWAYRSREVRQIVEGDLLLYEHGRTLFEKQTAESLGTTWLEFPPRPQSWEPVGDAAQQNLARALVEGLGEG